MTFGDRIISWLLRRLEHTTPLHSDLVLVLDHPALEDTPAVVEHRAKRWRFARVYGELTLREALPDGDRLIAAIPLHLALPLDIRARAYLGRGLELRPQDLVAGLAGRPCAPLVSRETAEGVMAGFDVLRRHTGVWTLGDVVTEAEVRSVMIAAELGGSRRLEQTHPEELLCQWILEGVPVVHTPAIWAEALQESHGRVGRWLAWAAGEQSLDALLSAGALAGSAEGRAAAPSIPGVGSEREWGQLRTLVEKGVRLAHEADPVRTAAALKSAEGTYHQLRPPARVAERHPLLRAALDSGLHYAARTALEGTVGDDEWLPGLRRNLHASDLGETITLVQDLVHLSHFVASFEQVLNEDQSQWTLRRWCQVAWENLAWADWAIRRVRRSKDSVSGDVSGAAGTILTRAISVRDRLNRTFASWLAAHWSQVSISKDLRRPLPVHQITRVLIRRLVDAGQRVLMVVLDGCDLSTAVELLANMPDGLGLALPKLPGGPFQEDLQTLKTLPVGVSLIPTVTGHARRALFAGEVPGHPALSEPESAVANASKDEDAWSRNTALKDLSYPLLLKGALGTDGGALRKALQSGASVVGVVINAIDDTLSSKATTPLGPWSFAGLGGGLVETLREAASTGWTVVLTADHGHTPHVASDRKVEAKADGQRFSRTKTKGAVCFEGHGIPDGPLWLLTDVGAWHGQQRQGYHGGAGLEEVLVPLIVLGEVQQGHSGLAQGTWWHPAEDDPHPAEEDPYPAEDIPQVASLEQPVGTADASPSTLDITDALRQLLGTDARSLRAVEELRQHQVLTNKQLATLLGMAPFMVRGLMSKTAAAVARAGLEVPFVSEERETGITYRWKIRT